MSASEMQRTLLRLAHEIAEKNDGVDGLGLVGIRRRGVPLAEHLGKLISRIESTTIPVGSLDITFFIATTSRPLAEACSAQVRYRL
jgi:pyrimidine operon attenuation protein / uracil phosphoribosyltransferase